MDLFKLLYVFVKVVLSLCLLPFAKQKPSWSSTKILKLVKDSSLNVGVEWVKVLNALSPSCLWQCSCIFCFFVSLYFCVLYLYGHCAAYVALLLSTLPKCQPPSLAGSRNIHQQNAAMTMRTAARTMMTTMMRTTRTTTKIQKPAFHC